MERESDRYGTTKMQRALLPMLKDFDSFCSRSRIQYSLDGGTLLGAVRHQGFIPWDDDVDVMMDRKNFEKFLSSWRDTDRYYLTRRLWVYRIFRVQDDRADRARNSEGRPAIDIFVFDHCPDQKFQKKVKELAIKVLQGMMHQEIKREGISAGYQVCLIATYAFGRLFPDDFKFKLYDKISCWGNKNNSNYKSIYNNLFKFVGREYPFDILEKTERHVFEEMELPITKKYDEYLTITYGDYMVPPPEEKRIPEHMG